MTRPLTIIPVGGPGVGKSNLMNKLIGNQRFKSSSSAGCGVTKKISHYTGPAFG